MTLTPPGGEHAATSTGWWALACGWLLLALIGLVLAALGTPAGLCLS